MLWFLEVSDHVCFAHLPVMELLQVSVNAIKLCSCEQFSDNWVLSWVSKTRLAPYFVIQLTYYLISAKVMLADAVYPVNSLAVVNVYHACSLP